ncbi:MAG: ABC transporter permease [Candidatus Eisenbacteria bacterium]|nr:ABC transporter permease [Candidatus Eisenbacteria bacterium]
MQWQQVFANVSPSAWRVWQRDLDVFLTTWKTNFLPPLLEPVLYVLAFGVGMGSLIGLVVYQGEELPYLRFMIPGVICVAIMFWAYFETTYSSFVRMYYQRTFDAIIATPLLVEDVIAGEWLWGGTKAVLTATIMLGMMGLFGLVSWPSALLVVPLAVVGGLLFSALGLICTALVPKIDSFNVPAFLLIFPMFLFSGTFFPIDILPRWAMGFALTLPLTHVSYLVRGACLGRTPPFWLANVAYLLGATLLTAALALILMRRRLIK